MKSIVQFIFSLVLCALAPSVLAKQVPPLFIGTAPKSLKVSYGALKKAVQLQFYLVSNLPKKSQALSRFRFQAKSNSRNVTVKSITNTCKSKLPPQGPKGICNVFVNITVTGVQPPSHTSLQSTAYKLSFKYGNGRDAIYESDPVDISFATGRVLSTASRTFTFENYCDYDVWFGIASGATQSIKPAPATPKDKQSCTDTINSSDCYPGSRCIEVKTGLNHCFWLNPKPADNNYRLKRYRNNKADKNTVSFKVYDNGVDAVWSGGIAGRSNCSASSCDTGDCNKATKLTGHDGACPIGSGFDAPVSTVEFTLLGQLPLIITTNTDADTYDVTVINGVTTPISISPVKAVWGGAKKPYQCGSPGAASKTQSSAACQWQKFSPPSSKYVYVKYNALAASCAVLPCATKGEVCGSSFNPVGSVVNVNVCGIPLGYWTADAICAKEAAFVDNALDIDCSAPLPAPDATYTQRQLYGCSKGIFGKSCYTAGAVSGKCCGCVDWDTIKGVGVPAPPITASCGGIATTNWKNLSRDKLIWLKKACPSAYVYPYDDASSTFTCQKLNAHQFNQVDYTIRFCPKD